MTTRSFGMTKQSPWPQQNSPLALRKRPREIQLSWASAIEPEENDAASNRKRARMGLRIHKVPSLSPCAATTVQAEKSSPAQCRIADSVRVTRATTPLPHRQAAI